MVCRVSGEASAHCMLRRLERWAPDGSPAVRKRRRARLTWTTGTLGLGMPFIAIGVAHVLPVTRGGLDTGRAVVWEGVGGLGSYRRTTRDAQGRRSPSQKQPGTSHFTLANSKLSLPNNMTAMQEVSAGSSLGALEAGAAEAGRSKGKTI